MSRILPLSADAISQICSSKQITSLQGVVLALLENSLDARASKIDVTVDFRRGGCTVEDNGFGIPPTEFEADGGLGRIYHTSKHGTVHDGGELHGSTGTYIASLAALSLLSITSRHREHDYHATFMMHRASVVARHVPAPPSHELSMAHGTRVIVRDLFGNMPVRMKQRTLAGENNAEDERAWQELKRGVAALLLAWSRPCAARLHDVHSEARTVSLSGGHPGVNRALTEKTLNQLAGKAAKYDLRDALPIVFQAGLASHGSRRNWVPISASAGSLAVKGAICLDPAPTKQCQFISMGVHPCATTSGHHDLYDTVNRVFTNSSFGAIDDVPDIDETEKLRRKHDRRYKNDGYTQKQLQVRKGVDRWPMFALQLNLRDARHQRTATEMTSETSLKGMLDLLEAAATQWLTAHHFRPQKCRRRKNADQQAPAPLPSSPLRRASTAGSISRASLAEVPATPSLKRAATAASATTSKKRRIIDLSGTPSSRGDDNFRQSPSTYFNGLSCIKSGRGSTYNDVSEVKKPATAPTGQSGTAKTALDKPKKHPFKLVPVEAGELSSAMRPTNLGPRAHAELPAEFATGIEIASGVLTSDDFGSVDDAALVEATEKAECGGPAIDEVPGSPTVESESVATNAASDPSDAIVNWTDPMTKQTYQVKVRTGVVLPVRTAVIRTAPKEGSVRNTVSSRQKAAIDTSVSSAGQALSLARRTMPLSTSTGTRWLPGFLKDWNNPVFKKQDEKRIPVASFEGPGVDIVEAGNHRCTDRSMTQHFAKTGDKGTSRLFKAALKQARVIGQVDEKFILCSMPHEAGWDGQLTLVLVDQHAASERVILEALLAELCTSVNPSTPAASYTPSTEGRSVVQSALLERPQRLEISDKESELFTRHVKHFARWGILYDVRHAAGVLTGSHVREPPSETQLVVRALPPGIAERCTLFPNLLIELLRSEVWTISQQSTRTFANTVGSATDEHHWLRRIGSCPKGIVEILNSRACRSAIMFNDVLSVAQCEDLLAALSKCAFPFMCAHGRVSMVPLVDLEGDGEEQAAFGVRISPFAGRNGAGKGFADAFRAWRKESMDAH